MTNETTIREKLIAAQADMANPVKTKAVKAGARQYNYEVLSDVLEIVTDALHAHGLALIQGVKPIITDHATLVDGADVGTVIGWWLQTKVTDGKEELTLDTRPLDFPSDPQAAGSKETYYRRYALKTAFGLAGVDDDGEAAHQMALKGSQKPQETRKPSTPTSDPLEGWKRRFAALRAEARQKGLDDIELGKKAANLLGRPSTEWGATGYETACRLIENAIDGKEV